MSEKKSIFVINILKNIISVYFDTFFVLYFFQVANYEVIPLAKYYIILYLFIGIGFLLIRNSMKKNIKVPYFQLGISMQALYIALIMLLKDKIINYIFLVGIVKGIADGFYYYPKSILDSEKISNENRQKFTGIVNTINQITSIIIPLCLGVLLTFMSYTDLGKVFFILFIIMFLVSFWINDEKHYDKKFEMSKFLKLIKRNCSIKNSLLVPILSGLTYSSGVMGLIITLYKINIFKTNLNLGFVDSITAALSLLICILYSSKIKLKHFKFISIFSGFVSLISLLLFSIIPNVGTLIFYLLVRYSFILIISLISENVVVNLTNCEEIKNDFKAEYYCMRDILFSISRSFGYVLLLLVTYVFGSEYIYFILIIAGLFLFTESIIVAKLTFK